ncbi:hypothetical protein LTS15_002750 [Exophiala xenobiotica]|nr:hypothetical protein LTS15_002750 [Exophiala xenobiotica]
MFIFWQRCNFDVQRAIRQHAIRSRYLGTGRPSRSQSHTPAQSEAASEADRFSPLPSPRSLVNVGDIEADEISEHGSEALEHPSKLNLDAPASVEVSRRGPSHTPESVPLVPALSNLRLSNTVRESPEQDLWDYDQPDEDVSDVTDETRGLEEWNFILPKVPYAFGPNAEIDSPDETFNVRDAVGAIQNGASLKAVQNYLERFSPDVVRRAINDEVDGFPAIFFVAGSNDESLLRLWIGHGGDPEAIHSPSKVPLLAFAIVNSAQIQSDTTLITSTLLSLGASPNVIPSAYYIPYLEDLSENGSKELKRQDENNDQVSQDPSITEWCTESARVKLVKTLTLSQRYFLEKASKTKASSQRQAQLAQRRNAEALLGLPYFLVGQTMASNLLLQKLLSHLISPSKRPLVLVFAGPSGHGKTELARKLGHLLSLELEVVDCTIFNREIELFGPREPYVGSEKGSPLNNFLARNAGKRCIVFLDEFEKTNPDIHKTLLLPFQNGDYQDRRDRSNVNCSNTIWILATNAHDAIIQAFSSAHQEELFGDVTDAEKLRLAKPLAAEIKQDFLSKFGSPITGRISAFIPFLRFSLGEQAVVVHKYLLELGYAVEGPVNLSFGPQEKLLGDVRVRIRRDASVCRILAKAEYHEDLGARSLINAVDTIKGLLVEAYLGIDEQIVESADKSVFLVDVQGNEIVVKLMGHK